MAAELAGSKQLVGKSHTQVSALLGPPSKSGDPVKLYPGASAEDLRASLGINPGEPLPARVDEYDVSSRLLDAPFALLTVAYDAAGTVTGSDYYVERPD